MIHATFSGAQVDAVGRLIAETETLSAAYGTRLRRMHRGSDGNI